MKDLPHNPLRLLKRELRTAQITEDGLQEHINIPALIDELMTENEQKPHNGISWIWDLLDLASTADGDDALPNLCSQLWDPEMGESAAENIKTNFSLEKLLELAERAYRESPPAKHEYLSEVFDKLKLKSSLKIDSTTYEVLAIAAKANTKIKALLEELKNTKPCSKERNAALEEIINLDLDELIDAAEAANTASQTPDQYRQAINAALTSFLDAATEDDLSIGQLRRALTPGTIEFAIQKGDSTEYLKELLTKKLAASPHHPSSSSPSS